MNLLITCDLGTLRRFDTTHLGSLLVPGMQGRVKERLDTGPVACDNLMFSGVTPKKEKAVHTLARYLVREGVVERIDWLACIDKVKNASETRRLWDIWKPILADYGIPLAYVLQDGSEKVPVPENADAIFIGGSDAYKESPHAHGEVQKARARGWLAHMGRVSAARRFELAYNAGCTSIDGSIFGKAPDAHIPRAVEILARLHREPPTLEMSQTTIAGWA